MTIQRSKVIFSRFIVISFVFFSAFPAVRLRAESGYDLWLRYAMPSNQERAQELANAFARIEMNGDSKTRSIIRDEFPRAKSCFTKNLGADDKLAGTVLVGTPSNLPAIY